MNLRFGRLCTSSCAVGSVKVFKLNNIFVPTAMRACAVVVDGSLGLRDIKVILRLKRRTSVKSAATVEYSLAKLMDPERHELIAPVVPDDRVVSDQAVFKTISLVRGTVLVGDGVVYADRALPDLRDVDLFDLRSDIKTENEIGRAHV